MGAAFGGPSGGSAFVRGVAEGGLAPSLGCPGPVPTIGSAGLGVWWWVCARPRVWAHPSKVSGEGVRVLGDEQVVKPSEVRPFTAVLAEFDDGLVNQLLGQELHALTEQVVSTGRAGSVTLQIELKPVSSSRTGVIEAKAKVTVSPPKTDPHTSIFFTDRTGNLSRRDDRQLEVPTVKLVGKGESA